MVKLSLSKDDIYLHFENLNCFFDKDWAQSVYSQCCLIKTKGTRFSRSLKKIETNGQNFYISKLDEVKMRNFMNAAEDGDLKAKEVFKGTTFGGKSRNIFSAFAMALKQGLPEGISVPLGVKFYWTATDLVRYVTAIQKAMGQEVTGSAIDPRLF